jgi:hypothetical protein
MRIGRLVGSVLIFVPLLVVCAGRLHAQRGGTPQGVTQEVNRCLTVVRVAASRRRRGEGGQQRGRQALRLSTNRQDLLTRPRSSAKSA